MNLKGSSLSLLKGEKLATSQQSYRGAIFHSHKIIDTSLGSQFSLSICFYVTTLRRTKSRAAGRRTGSFLPYSLLLPHLPANLFNKVGFASSQGTDKSLLEQKRKPLFFCLFCSLQRCTERYSAESLYRIQRNLQRSQNLEVEKNNQKMQRSQKGNNTTQGLLQNGRVNCTGAHCVCWAPQQRKKSLISCLAGDRCCWQHTHTTSFRLFGSKISSKVGWRGDPFFK